MRTADALAGREPAGRPLGLSPPFGRLLLVLLRTSAILGLGVALAIRLGAFPAETWLFWNQDLPVFGLDVALIVALGLAPARWLASLAPALDQPPRLWVSGLAAICLVAGVAAAPLGFHGDWYNSLLGAASIAATWAVGRRLWPDKPRLALVAAALLAGSAQLIVTSMTADAMPAQLAFNMAWLWLFLRGGRLGHAGAIVVGFLATDFHQLPLHPLFAAPFVLQLWLDRRWRLAGVYTLAYAAIGAFWIASWPLAVVAVAPTLAASPGAIGPMAERLVRFVTWQNPLAATLALAGAAAAERAKGHLRALALGVVLTLIALLFLAPTLAGGWGYPCLHGLLGSIALLAAWSWGRMTDPLDPERRAAANGALVVACAVSLVVLTPVRAWQAWAYVQPSASLALTPPGR